MSSWIFFFVASLVRKSLSMEMVDMLSDLNSPAPACGQAIFTFHLELKSNNSNT